VTIWAAERLIRLVRLILFSWQGLDWTTLNATAIVEDIEHEHLLRLTVSTTLTYTPKAGTYYFLYFPTVFSPFENHPFTLSGWSRRPDGRIDLHFLIKEQQGVTRKLVRRTRKAGNRLDLKVWLEGPYGRAAPLQDYEHLLMVRRCSPLDPLETIRLTKFLLRVSGCWWQWDCLVSPSHSTDKNSTLGRARASTIDFHSIALDRSNPGICSGHTSEKPSARFARRSLTRGGYLRDRLRIDGRVTSTRHVTHGILVWLGFEQRIPSQPEKGTNRSSRTPKTGRNDRHLSHG
jgi:hypothetical protein